jgi:HlyD family secretion protein
VLIGSEAEFAPRSIESQDERVKMVFAVTIHLDNPGHSLKPGLPADVGFITEEG